MSLSVVIPQTLDRQLYQCLADIIRHAADNSTINANFNVQITVTGNDIKIVTSGKGLVLPDANGTSHTCRLEALYDAPTTNWVLVLTPLT